MIWWGIEKIEVLVEHDLTFASLWLGNLKVRLRLKRFFFFSFFFFLFFLFCWGLVLWFFIHLNLDLHFCPPYYAFSVCLGTTYLIETENFLLKVLYIKVKISQIVQWNPWIISKNLVGLMNNSKNKLKVEIRWKIQLIPNAH